MTAILTLEPWRDWPPRVHAETVARYGGDTAGSSGFRVVHNRRHCQPWGLFLVYVEGQVIGRLLSFPSYGDCLGMLEAFQRDRAALTFAADRRSYSEGRRRRRRRSSAPSLESQSAPPGPRGRSDCNVGS